MCLTVTLRAQMAPTRSCVDFSHFMTTIWTIIVKNCSMYTFEHGISRLQVDLPTLKLIFSPPIRLLRSNLNLVQLRELLWWSPGRGEKPWKDRRCADLSCGCEPLTSLFSHCVLNSDGKNAGILLFGEIGVQTKLAWLGLLLRLRTTLL